MAAWMKRSEEDAAVFAFLPLLLSCAPLLRRLSARLAAIRTTGTLSLGTRWELLRHITANKQVHKLSRWTTQPVLRNPVR